MSKIWFYVSCREVIRLFFAPYQPPAPLSLRLLCRSTSLCRNFNSSSVIQWSPVVWKQRNRRTSHLTPPVDLTHVFCSFVWGSGNNLYQASLLRPTLSFGRKKVAWKENRNSDYELYRIIFIFWSCSLRKRPAFRDATTGGTSAENPCWWCITSRMWVDDWMKQILNQSEVLPRSG